MDLAIDDVFRIPNNEVAKIMPSQKFVCRRSGKHDVFDLKEECKVKFEVRNP